MNQSNKDFDDWLNQCRSQGILIGGFREDRLREIMQNIREESIIEMENIIDNFNKPETLKLSYSDLGVTCPICQKSRCIWSRVLENPRKEICIYCRINLFKNDLRRLK